MKKYCCLRIPKRNEEKAEKGERKAIMRKNGAALLKELIASSKSKYNRTIRIFSANELKTATNNYSYPLSLKRNAGYYKMYKGYLREHSISVMKFQNEMEAYQLCYNNIVYALHMNHGNVVKLIGCCVETRIPILVFEGIGYGTLADRIHYRRQPFFDRLLWAKRLNIAMELANALSYLHAGFPKPIISRSVKLSKILFDEQGLVKLFDFTQAAFVSKDETHVNDEKVKAAMRYIAPEYAIAGDLNEKSDVYNFGVILLQLLLGQETMDSTEYEHIILRERLEKCIGNNKFNEIVDPIIIEDGVCLTKKQQLKDFISLALKCTSASAEDRPTMVYVTQQITKMYQSCN